MTAHHRHAWSLPGVLASTELVTVDDADGTLGLVRHQRTGTLTATLKVAATSTWLVDRDQADTWVAHWGAWLAGLGYVPTLRWIAVTVTTAPASAARLRNSLAAQLAPNAPTAAHRILRRLASVVPATTADVRTNVSITFDPARSPTRSRRLDDAVDEVRHRLPGLEDSLAACGVTVLGRATGADLTATVLTAFDPTLRDDIDRIIAADGRLPDETLLDWSSAGPVAADEEYGLYRHDAAISVSWAWHEAPRQQVHAEVLARLLAPGQHHKRVTLLYRPLPAADAAKAVEREVNAAVFRDTLRVAQRRDENARDHADRGQAVRAAREEAAGAGMGLISLFVTTTVLHPDDVSHAVADIETRADVARIRLRRLWGSQSVGFATTLPCGICPPQLVTWPV
nr:SCO6880 family protein [Cryptosporangium aurantiacum]